jgi:hypothetical protein
MRLAGIGRLLQCDRRRPGVSENGDDDRDDGRIFCDTNRLHYDVPVDPVARR